jgi:hypothetical protein
MTITLSYVGAPERKSVIERCMQTLKGQCINPHRVEALAEAQRIISEFIAHLTPSAHRTAWSSETVGSSGRAAGGVTIVPHATSLAPS